MDELRDSLFFAPKNGYDRIGTDERLAIEDYSRDYMDFLNNSRMEREAVKNAIAMATEHGFVEYVPGMELKPGTKVYKNNRGKSLMLAVIGKKSLGEGAVIAGAHVDSPRLDLKQMPLYESDEMAFFKTHYYGGIKKYQWVARPMALHGVVCRKDGSKVIVNIGEKADDPVVGVSDLLIHLAAKQMEKKGSTVVEGEALNVLAGSIPMAGEEKDPVRKYLLDLLKQEYDIEEDDFLSAEIEVVPAGEARDYGLDRSMILGYGHDDRVCAYTSLRAILEMKNPERTSCCILTDKEEIGSVGATGMHSRWFEMVITTMLAHAGKADLVHLNETLTNSMMLSSDVSAAVDPNYEDVNDLKNAAYFGKGIVFNKYTGARGKSGSNDANPEFIAKVRKAMEDSDVMFQTAELGAVDVGGGGTIAYILAQLNMDVMDAGIAVQNMHAPCEIVSKADVYEGYRAYKAFLTNVH